MANNEPGHIKVQHILIGFKGSVPGKPIVRSQEEASKLAYDLLNQARTGADFDHLVKKHTDDSPPGIYGMSNRGVPPASGEYPRDGMVPAFGNVGFVLNVGEIGVADYDSSTSPYGWHVIKRVS
jgi:parvulin-like peptidyl-prolyl isomerase